MVPTQALATINIRVITELYNDIKERKRSPFQCSELKVTVSDFGDKMCEKSTMGKGLQNLL